MDVNGESGVAVRLPNRTFVSAAEVARWAGVSRAAVVGAIKIGKLRASRYPGTRDWLIYIKDAREYVRPRRGGCA